MERSCFGHFRAQLLKICSRLLMAVAIRSSGLSAKICIVEADIFKEGHDVVAAALKWRMVGEIRWHETPMKLIDNDRWRGICTFYENATYEYTVEAWVDVFTGWQHEFSTKFEAGVTSLRSEALEGAALIEQKQPNGHMIRMT